MEEGFSVTVFTRGVAATAATRSDSLVAVHSRALAGCVRGVSCGLEWLQRVTRLGIGSTGSSAASTGSANRAVELSVLIVVGPALVLLWLTGIPGIIIGLLLGRIAGVVVRAMGEKRCERREAGSAAVTLETLTAQLYAGVAASGALNAVAAKMHRAENTTVLADHLARAAHRASSADPWGTEEPPE